MIALLGLLTATAWANGQTVHVWITRAALADLPPGEMADLLRRADLEPMIVHGTMFPDGGYPLGHPYAETAHWEPFQMRYLEWIQAHYEPPWTDEAAQHIAFLFGMASHGMADQSHDAWLFDWSQTYDAEAGWADGYGLDEANDFVWAGNIEPSTFPARWIPDTLFVELFADLGVEVDVETLNQGQGLLELAIELVALGSQNPDTVDKYAARFPWGCSHILDVETPGNPEFEADTLELYWGDLWARLHDTDGPVGLLRTWPDEGGVKAVRDHTALEARVSLVFSRGLINAEVYPERFTVTDSAGHAYAFDTRLFYGDNSHIVHLIPTEDWAADEDFTVTAKAGLPARDDTELAEDVLFHFTTREPPPAADGDTGATPGAGDSPESATESGKGGCGCSSTRSGSPGRPRASALALGLLGAALLRRARRLPSRVSPPRG